MSNSFARSLLLSQVLAVGPRPFSPGDLSGLQLWLKADSLSSLSDGDPISLWSDSSGNARDATASGSDRPTYKSAILNGLPVVRFDGSTNHLTLSLGVPSLPHFSVFFVHKGDGMVMGSTEPPGSRYLWSRVSPNDFETYFGGNFRGYTISGLGSFGYTSITYDGSTATCYRGGTSVGSDSDPTATGIEINLIGEYGFSANPLPLTGDIAEFIVYDSSLSGTDRGLVEGYLASKYGL